MAKKILQHTKNEIMQVKCWGLIGDSTPDVSQLSVVLRYYLIKHEMSAFLLFAKGEGFERYFRYAKGSYYCYSRLPRSNI